MGNREDAPTGEVKKEEFLQATLWGSKFTYKRARYFPKTRERIAARTSHLVEERKRVGLGKVDFNGGEIESEPG